MCYVYSNNRMLSVYLREVHVGTLPEICSSATWAGGGKQTRARVFPGIISARKVFYEDIPACMSLELAEKGGANMGPGEAVESRKSVGPSTALDRGYAAGISADGFA